MGVSEALSKIGEVKKSRPRVEIHEISQVDILKEIANPALKDLSRLIMNILERVQKGEMVRTQAMLEIQAHKQLIALIVLDWNSRKKI